VSTAGCARLGHAGGAADVAAASPSTSAADLAGRWHGAAWGAGEGFYAARSSIALRIDDSTWTADWTTNRVPKHAAGTLTTRGNRIVLRNSTTGAVSSLRRSGNTLYGVVPSPDLGVLNNELGVEVMEVRLTKG
jgi:hypothetical protein